MHYWLLRTYEPLSEIDGNTRQFRFSSLIREILKKKNNTVTLWTSDFNHTKKIFRNDNVKTEMTYSNFRIIFLPAFEYKHNISFSRIYHNRLVARNFIYYSQKEKIKPDIIVSCVPTLELAEAGIKYGTTNNIPVVTDFEDIWPDVYLMGLPFFLRKIFGSLLFYENLRLKKIINKSRTCVTISNSYSNWLKRKSGNENKKYSVFPLGYPNNEFSFENTNGFSLNEIRDRFNIGSEDYVILFVGQLEKSYDVEVVISAAKAFLGDGSKRNKLMNSSDQLSNLIYTGWLSEVEILFLLKISNIGLIPYKKYAFQSLPYKPFEYMCGGLALLSSLKGDLFDIIQKEKIGLNYSAENKDSLIEKIEYFLDNEKITQEMGIRSRELFLKKYRSEFIYSEYANFISKMIPSEDGVTAA